MDAHPDLPVELGINQGRVHLQPAANRGAYRVIELVEQAGNRHEAVADRLDFVEPMLGGDALENDKERIEPRHHVFRLMLVAIGGEIGHVAEQDRDILVDWVRLWRHLSARTASGARLNCFGNGSEGAGRPSSMDMAN